MRIKKANEDAVPGTNGGKARCKGCGFRIRENYSNHVEGAHHKGVILKRKR